MDEVTLMNLFFFITSAAVVLVAVLFGVVLYQIIHILRVTRSLVDRVEKFGAGIGVTAAALTAAAGYLLFGAKGAKKNREKAQKFAGTIGAGDVLVNFLKASAGTEQIFKELIEDVAKAYHAAREAGEGELLSFVEEIKSHAKTAGKSGKKRARAAAEHISEAAVESFAKSKK